MSTIKFVKAVMDSFRTTSGLEPRLFAGLQLTAAQEGRVNFELSIEKHHTNRLAILHGGTIAGLVDLGGSLAVSSRGLYSTGVTTDLNVTYLRSGGKIGDTILGRATCDKFGKTLAYTTVEFSNPQGQLVARGSHTKFLGEAWKDPKNMTRL